MLNLNIIEYDPPVKLTFVEKWKEYGDVWSFRFRPSEKLPFLAGQNARIVIPDLPPEVAARSLSFASVPDDETVVFAMHTGSGSSFKKAMLALKGGGVVHLVKIKGETFLPKNETKPIVLIGGGIGVIPFRSMLLHIQEKKLPARATLVHVCHDEFLYQKELANMECKQYRIHRPNIEETLSEVVEDCPDSMYYIAGPPLFIAFVKETLQDLGISELRVRISRFTGYERLWD